MISKNDKIFFIMQAIEAIGIQAGKSPPPKEWGRGQPSS